MDSRSRPVKQLFRQYLAERSPAAVTEAVWQELLVLLAPVSETYLRELVRETGLPFEQPYAGIRQHTLEELEASLMEMLAVYQEAGRAGDGKRARYCRRQIIAAKDRARFLAQNPKTTPSRKELKEEMVQWMLVWLEDPAVFPPWVATRKLQLSKEASG